jgi:adenosylhomocysteine nucleosidase
MNFLVALQPEARPLIEKFKLKKRNGTHPFSVFENETHRLVISGIGRIQAAAATGFLLGQQDGRPKAIINLGIAGHGSLDLGTAFLANRIFHSQEKGIYYPPAVLESKISKSGLQTMDAPEKDYPEPIGYDMEAHAFCSIAYQSITRELVQVIKVVSDNPSAPLADFNPKFATDLLFANLSHIEEISEQLERLEREISMDPLILGMLAEIRAKLHCTATQVHQLERILQQAHALGMAQDEIRYLLKSSTHTKNLLSSLAEKLAPLRILK